MRGRYNEIVTLELFKNYRDYYLMIDLYNERVGGSLWSIKY